MTVILHGGKRRARQAAGHMVRRLAGLERERVQFTRGAGEMAHRVMNVAGDCDLLVIGGGDGSLSEAVNGLMSWQLRFPDQKRPLLAFYPMGTGNDYARNFGWRTDDVDQLAQRLAAGEVIRVGVGRIESAGQVRYFVNAADAGLGAHVVTLVEQMKGAWPRAWVYPLAILRGFLTYRHEHSTLRIHDRVYSGNALTTVICLGKYFGDGIQIAPSATPRGTHFTLVRVGNVSLVHYLRYLPALRRGKRIAHPEIFYTEVTQVELSGAGRIEADGEPAGTLPASITLEPRILELLG